MINKLDEVKRKQDISHQIIKETISKSISKNADENIQNELTLLRNDN